MEHYRLRKYRGPEVWARVRQAYEAGESGPSVARRFDVGLANLRKKARQEAWSRRHTAARLDRELEPGRPDAARTVPFGGQAEPAPVDPRRAVEEAMQRAGGLLAQGRSGEAQALVRSAEALARLVERAEPAKAAAELQDEASQEDDVAQWMAERDADIIDQATKLAWSHLVIGRAGASTIWNGSDPRPAPRPVRRDRARRGAVRGPGGTPGDGRGLRRERKPGCGPARGTARGRAGRPRSGRP